MNQEAMHMDESLLMLYITGEAKPEEIKHVEQWLADSEENRKKLDQVHEIWIQSRELNIPPVDVDIQAAWEKVSSRIEEQHHSRGKRILWPRQLLRIAAVALIIMAGIWMVQQIRQSNAPVVLLSHNLVVTETLEDGSGIALNKNSEIVVSEDFNKKERRIELKGEAYFEVAKDPEKAFRIRADETWITVLGTSFNVQAYADSSYVGVQVTEGLVRFSAGETDEEWVNLEAGESASFDKKSKQIIKEDRATPNDLYWLNKTLVFEKTRLSEVFSLLEQIFQVNINVLDPSINNLLLSATFQDNHLDEVIAVISATFDLEYHQQQKEIIIRYAAADE